MREADRRLSNESVKEIGFFDAGGIAERLCGGGDKTCHVWMIVRREYDRISRLCSWLSRAAIIGAVTGE